ncbi:MAG: Holliday junction branch migration DNA helicase RuvB [Dehalococcoidia bacterium]|nr:Holliday junction branch migration DNA helicase RuvB [Dehalococcoidia bacterium]
MAEDGEPTASPRLVTPRVQVEDTPLDRTLRPRRLEEYVGQQQVKNNLRIAMQAAKQRKEALDHTIFYGPPGLGKTTLAYIIAQEMGVNIRVTSGPAIEKPGEMASLLTVLEPYDIFFIDEIHRLSRLVEEVLYPAMEEQRVDVVLPGKGPGSARMLRINLKPFTLVGATTRFAMVSAPLRERFGSIYRLDFYTPEDLEIIVLRSAEKLGIKIEPAGATEIAARSRGTPRIANRLLRRLRDFAQVRGKGVITKAIAQESLASLQVDPMGLDLIDVKLLTSLIEKYGGGPVGLETLAAAVGEESDTVMDVYEPYLLQLGFLDRTPKGRVATPLAYRHLGLPDPRAAQQEGRAQQERLL